MKRIMKIYQYALKYPVYFMLGFVSLFLYACFSGISITLVIPLFDNIFVADRSLDPIYLNFADFYQAISDVLRMRGENAVQLLETGITSWKNLWSSSKTVLALTDPWLLLKLICTILVILYFLKNVFYFLNRIMFINLRGKTIQKIRNDCYKNYLSQSYAFFNQNRVGDSIVRMINDIDMVNNMFIDKFFKVIREFSLVIVYAIIAFSLNQKLFWLSLLVFPPFTLAVKYLSNKMKKYAKKIQAQLSNMFSNIEEVLNSMRIVKAFCKEDYEHQKLLKLNKKYFNFWRRAQVYWSFGVPISELSTVFIGIAILFIGSASILEADSSFTFGDFTAFLFAMFSMMHPLKVIINDITDLKKAMVSVDRVCEILELKSEIVDIENPAHKSDFYDKIEFRDVCFAYHPDIPVLQDCNLVINKGEKVAFVGSSGSGKTTLVNLINRMYDVTAGEVLIDGINIKNIKVNEFRRLFGVVTQESILFTETIENNIKYGSGEDKTIDDVQNACHFAYADEFIDNLPDGYQTSVLPHGSNFSGGQKQRLCIARAIINHPAILIFDEATSALDTESEQKVQKAIDMAVGNHTLLQTDRVGGGGNPETKRTVIIIAHRLSTILSADKIIVLDKGKIVGIGKHEDLILSSPKYKHFYDLQFSPTGAPANAAEGNSI